MDLRDTRGRLVTLAIAVVLGLGAGLLALAALRTVVHAAHTAAEDWFAIATVGMVAVPATIAFDALLARVRVPAREDLPRARVVRPQHHERGRPWRQF